MYFAGLMSGTSMDGIDAVIVDEHNQLICADTFPYHKETHCRLDRLVDSRATTLNELGTLHRQIALEFSHAYKQLVKQSQLSLTKVKAIGFHGQTISHQASQPPFYSLQIGCPSTLCVECATPVVADFRSMDIALGGQGAPLAPLYHQYCFAPTNSRVAVVNIGGIANLSVLCEDKIFAGFDTGPGNCLLNAWIKQILDLDYDMGGSWSATGKINEALLHSLLTDPYFSKKYPKSADREYFSLAWLESHLRCELKAEDIQATLVELTAITISNEVKQFNLTAHLILCGGGAHNRHLHARLTQHLSNIHIHSSAHYGVDEDYLEAMMMAWLARQRVAERQFDLSAITGNKFAIQLGQVFNPPIEIEKG